ncbi:MAG: hypothetical protein AB9842_05575, partial [Bacteroidales bacterium]
MRPALLISLLLICLLDLQAQQPVKVRKYYDPAQKKHIREEYSVIKKDTSQIKQGDYKRYSPTGKVIEFASYEQGKLIRKHVVRHENGILKGVSYYQPNGDYWKYSIIHDSSRNMVSIGYESQTNGSKKSKFEISDQKLVVDSLLRTINDRGMHKDSRIKSFLKENDFNIESVYMNANVKFKNKNDWQWQYDRNNQVIYLLMSTIEDYAPLRGMKRRTK